MAAVPPRVCMVSLCASPNLISLPFQYTSVSLSSSFPTSAPALLRLHSSYRRPGPPPRDWALDPHRIRRRRARRHSPRRLPVSLRSPVPVAAPAAGGFLPAPAFPTFPFHPGPGSRVPDFARSCGGRCPRPPPWRRRDPARAWQGTDPTSSPEPAEVSCPVLSSVPTREREREDRQSRG